jgi:hypothetical protein
LPSGSRKTFQGRTNLARLDKDRTEDKKTGSLAMPTRAVDLNCSVARDILVGIEARL